MTENSRDKHYPIERVDYTKKHAQWRYELHMYQLRPAPPKKDNLQAYIDLYFAEKDDKYIAWFLHYYEATLNNTAMSLVQRYALPGHFPALKSTMIYGIWLALLQYTPEYGVPFLTFKTRIMWKEIHGYIRSMRSGYTVPSAAEYAMLRKVMHLYREYGGKQDAETISRICAQVGLKEKTLQTYLSGGRRNLYETAFYHSFAEDEDSELCAENVTRDYSWEPESAYAALVNNRILMTAYENLENTQRDIITGHLKFCKNCYGLRPGKNTFQELAYQNGLRSAASAERIYYKAIDQLIFILTEQDFCHCLQLKLIQNNNVEIIYQYRVDNDGAWGEILYDCTTKKFSIPVLADLDLSQSKRYAQIAIGKIQDMLSSGSLLKEKLWAIK